MIRAIAIDDEPPALEIIKGFCSRLDFISLQKAFTQPHEALRYVQNYPVDLIFLDIQMPSSSGIDFSRQLPDNMMVIFTTAYSEYAVEEFNLSAVDYLLKPYTFERFSQALNKANEYQQFMRDRPGNQQDYLFVRADYSLVKVMHQQIQYVEGLDDYVKIFRKNDKPLIARMTMKSLEEQLPSAQFLRVHRSFIVSIREVHGIRNKKILLADRNIPVGGTYTNAVQTLLGEKSG